MPKELQSPKHNRPHQEVQSGSSPPLDRNQDPDPRNTQQTDGPRGATTGDPNKSSHHGK